MTYYTYNSTTKQLAAAEVAANHAVDAARFNLPTA